MVKEISTSTAAVGLLGFIVRKSFIPKHPTTLTSVFQLYIQANKGATAVRLIINSTAVTFVCAHLAAFDDYVERRNSDFADVARKLEFPITSRGTRSMGALSANVWETEMLFWLGGR